MGRAASTYNTEKTTFLLNWYANPYHTPIYVAKEQGWLKEEGIDLAILEATDPSDVTEIVGDGAIGLGLKAMIHILAAKDKGIDLKSFGTLLDEPPTGLIHKKSANINKFSDIQGKKVGYIGHFGKVMIDDLAKQAGIPLDSFETVRVGMNVTAAILRGDIDTGVGFTNFQRIELEELSAEDAGMLRIDELNDLGCCCFCSVQYVANGDYFEKNPEKISGFMRAMRRATEFTIEHPDAAWKIMTRANPRLDNNNLLNVDRDWEKVGQFCKHLGVLETDFDQHSVWTNEHVPEANTSPEVQPVTPGGIGVDVSKFNAKMTKQEAAHN